jgi:hypothetical protein
MNPRKQKCWRCGGQGTVDSTKAKLSPSQERNRKSYGEPICPTCNGKKFLYR